MWSPVCDVFNEPNTKNIEYRLLVNKEIENLKVYWRDSEDYGKVVGLRLNVNLECLIEYPNLERKWRPLEDLRTTHPEKKNEYVYLSKYFHLVSIEEGK